MQARTLRLFAVLAVLALLALPLAAQELDTDDKKTLYALGLAISQQLQPFALTEADLAIIEQGISDGVLGREAKVVAALQQGAADLMTLTARAYPEVPPAQATVIILGGSAAGIVAAALLTGDFVAVSGPVASPDVWLLLLFAGIAGAGIPSTMLLVAIRMLGGLRTGTLMLFEPVAGSLLAAIVLGQVLAPAQIAGGALVLPRQESRHVVFGCVGHYATSPAFMTRLTARVILRSFASSTTCALNSGLSEQMCPIAIQTAARVSGPRSDLAQILAR